MARLAATEYVGYVRVSTEEQARGESTDRQEARIREWAARQGLPLVGVEIDPGHSGKKLKRPGLDRVRDQLDRARVRGVVIAKLDRITRSVEDWSLLLRRYFGDGRPYELLSVADHIDTRTANGRIALGIRIQVFQWERETVSERTRDQLRYKAGRGLLVSRHPPYGFARVLDESPRERGVPRTSYLVGVPEELATRDLILALGGQGWGPKRICTRLNGDNIKTRSGGRWVPTTVRQILRRAERGGYHDVEAQGGGRA
jgi:DNA invertase Pin-like site-specific DNA recombinase